MNFFAIDLLCISFVIVSICTDFPYSSLRFSYKLFVDYDSGKHCRSWRPLSEEMMPDWPVGEWDGAGSYLVSGCINNTTNLFDLYSLMYFLKVLFHL